jgi:threonine-phosphate decarboxylase
MARSRSLIVAERAYLFERLAVLNGCRPFAGVVNYLLVKLTRPGLTAAKLRKAMLAHHVLIRDASNFRGLDDRFFRLAVRSRQENDRLLAALEQCLQGD